MNFIIGIILVPAAVFMRGLAVKYLWQWFLVPLGMTSINIWHALGISALVALLTMQRQKRDEDAEANFNFVFSIFFSLVALAFGWVYQYFM